MALVRIQHCPIKCLIIGRSVNGKLAVSKTAHPRSSRGRPANFWVGGEVVNAGVWDLAGQLFPRQLVEFSFMA